MAIQVRPSSFSSSAVLVLAVTTAVLSSTVAAHAMGRHYVAEALASTVDVVAVPEMTMGPYFQSESDYFVGSDMTAAAKAGYSSTITTDRVSVTKAIPLTLTLNIWNVTNGGTEVFPLVGADVFLWHCDGLGRYSAVSQSQQSEEGTTGQMWLRGKQTTSATGSVTFNTILAGWYTGRAIHYHVRVRLAGASSTSFASTTQLFLNQTFISSYSSVYPYTLDTNTMTLLADDMHYLAASASVRTKLVMNVSGSNTAGYGTTYNLGIDTSGLSASGAASTTSAATGSSVTGSVVTTNGALPPGMTSSATTTAAPPPATTSSATTTPATTTASLTSTSTSSSAATLGASIAMCVFLLMLLSMP